MAYVAVKEHFDIISAMSKSIEQISEDKVIDKEELSYVCFVHVQWGNQLQAAEEYIGSLNRDDLVGVEVDIEKLRRVVSTMPDSCDQPELPATSSDTITEQGLWQANRNRQAVIDRVGDETLADELLDDPCFKGVGPIGAIWDVECQMRR